MLNELNKNTLDFAEHRHPCFKMKECFSISNSILDLLKSLCFLFYISSKFHCFRTLISCSLLFFNVIKHRCLATSEGIKESTEIIKHGHLRKSNSMQKPWSPELLMDKMAFNQNNILLPWFLTSRQLTVSRE